ncbi:energy transducer TonB [Kangiella spongicola]|uniref:Protein TonB n=1 Tax=Kangiella spongicola TaxID=796379 RepID=A0A318D1W1_9GAMM|nr:energy transducer TonB [Kangiella spongicola]PXF63140.1 hypothetical protein DL796_06750 [Kangiella spongicola]
MKKLIISSLLLAGSALPLQADNSASKHFVLVTTHQNDIGEICPEMNAGQTLSFDFKSNNEVEFNLHYHEGEKVSYPIEPHKVTSLQQSFEAPIKQTYCLMWKGLSEEPAKIKLNYQILPKQETAIKTISEAIPIYQPQAEYPEEAMKNNIEGQVVFLLDIAPSGKATNIRVLHESPKDIFTDVSIKAVSKWMFKPKIIDRKPVEQTDMLYTMNYKLD